MKMKVRFCFGNEKQLFTLWGTIIPILCDMDNRLTQPQMWCVESSISSLLTVYVNKPI